MVDFVALLQQSLGKKADAAKPAAKKAPAKAAKKTPAKPRKAG